MLKKKQLLHNTSGSYDFASLYPTTMSSFKIDPEQDRLYQIKLRNQKIQKIMSRINEQQRTI